MVTLIVRAAHCCGLFRDKVLKKIGEDWVFLTLLGVTMALLSFIMDYAIEKCQEGKMLQHTLYLVQKMFRLLLYCM